MALVMERLRQPKLFTIVGPGGVGKTSLAVNLARTLERTRAVPVQLLDCDVEEPNAHLFLAGTPLGEETVNIAVPDFDPDQCGACDKCVEFCQFNALASVGKTPLLFPELCHGCGGCTASALPPIRIPARLRIKRWEMDMAASLSILLEHLQ